MAGSVLGWVPVVGQVLVEYVGRRAAISGLTIGRAEKAPS